VRDDLKMEVMNEAAQPAQDSDYIEVEHPKYVLCRKHRLCCPNCGTKLTHKNELVNPGYPSYCPVCNVFVVYSFAAEVGDGQADHDGVFYSTSQSARDERLKKADCVVTQTPRA
jgi:hypothetical protein